MFQFNSSQTSEDVGWGGLLYYTAKEVESTLAISESGMKAVAIEFTFEIRDSAGYDIQPKRNFTLINGEESYSPEKVTILEVEGWENEEWLLGYEDGKMRAVLEFKVPEEIESYGLVLKNRTLGYGVLIRFEE